MRVCLSESFLQPYWPFLTPHIRTVQAIKTLISDQSPGHISSAAPSPVLVWECQAHSSPALPHSEVHGAMRMQQMAVGKWAAGPGCGESGATQGKVAGCFLLDRDGVQALRSCWIWGSWCLGSSKQEACVYCGSRRDGSFTCPQMPS